MSEHQAGSTSLPAPAHAVRPDISGVFSFSSVLQQYQQRLVLNIPQLMLHTGEHYALIGANGSGKTTLLRYLNRNFPVDKGLLGYLPQKPYAFSVTVRQNVLLGFPPSCAMTRHERDKQVEIWLDRLDLQSVANQPGNRLSGGEAQKMALARILVVPRSVLLLDEPGNALDLNGLSLIDDVLAAYLKRHQCLMVMATHQLRLADRICSQMLFLDQGELLEQGSWSDHACQPVHPRLKRYLQYEQGGADRSC